MPADTLNTIDSHINTTWLKLCDARRKGRPTTEHEHTLDTLLDQRLQVTAKGTVGV